MIGPTDLAYMHQQNLVGLPPSQPAASPGWLCSYVLFCLLTKLLKVRPNGGLSGSNGFGYDSSSMKAEVEITQPFSPTPTSYRGCLHKL